MKTLGTGLMALWCAMPLAAIAADDDRPAELPRPEATQELDDRRLQRQHFLYDREHQPETDAAAPRAQECRSERVRVPRGDGTTAVVRVDRCR